MLSQNKDYMIHIHLQDSEVGVDTKVTKHNNFNNLCFHINKQLIDNFSLDNTLSSSQYDTIKDFMDEIYHKGNATKEDIIICYIHHRLHNILFNPWKKNLETNFSRIISKTLEITNNLLYKQLNTIIKSTIAHCQTEHGTKHWAKNTVLQTLKDFWYTEEELNGLSKSKLKLMLKHYKLNQTLTSLDIPLDISSSLQDKRNIIEQFQQEEQEKTEIQQWSKIIIKENKKRPKKPLWKREKINLSKIHHYTDEHNE